MKKQSQSGFKKDPNICYLYKTPLNVKRYTKSKGMKGLPGGPVVKIPPSNAGDMGPIPGWGTKISHATGQLSLRTATTEPTCSGACAPQIERSP